MKITMLDGQPTVNMGKTKSITITNHGCTYKISSDFLGIKIKRGDYDDDVLQIFPESNNEIVIK